MNRPASLFLAMTLALAGSAPALGQSDQASGCTAPEHRQFDFWLGTWKVKDTASGGMAGSSVIATLHGGCAISENWTDPSMTGSSVNSYDATDGRWHQTWTDSAGRRVVFSGEFRDGAMILTEDQPPQGAEPKTTLSRMTFTPLDDGGVRQQGERSTDGGTTWTKTFDLTYEPAP